MTCSPDDRKLCGNIECEICTSKSFASILPDHIIWSNDNEWKPHLLLKSSHRNVKLICNKCKHSFDNVIFRLSKSMCMCPFCSKPTRQLCSDEECALCWDNSFASNLKSQFWSKKNVVKPRDVILNSHQTVWFTCDKCKHDFTMLACMAVQSENWCSYCASSILCTDEECVLCWDRSFAAHPRSIDWSKNNNIKPRDVFMTTGVKYLFTCDKCNHEYPVSPSKIVFMNCQCSFCGNRRLCTDIDCKICKDKSFSDHPYAKFWSPKNELKPRDVFRGSTKKYWFNCTKCGNEYETSPGAIVIKGTGCPYCVNKTEGKMLAKLQEFGFSVQAHKWFDWCRGVATNRPLPFDFVLEDIKCIIEVDGPQHFVQISNWKAPEMQQYVDHYKMDAAIMHGYSVIRIIQDDVFRDLYDWWELLKSHLCLHLNPTRVYLCRNNEYDCYILEKEKIINIADDEMRTINEFLDSL